MSLKSGELTESMAAATNLKPLEICVSAGEASGDAYAARLIEVLRDRWSLEHGGADKLHFGGLAGSRTETLGVQLISNTSSWGTIGVTPAIRIFFRAMGILFKTKNYMSSRRPGLFVPIDFGFGNIKLARCAKKLGWKVLYFVPPGSWRRDRQGSDLPMVTDAIVTPFDWSQKLLSDSGATAYWFGHPIRQIIEEQRQVFQDNGGVRDSLAILPGSRKHEVEANLPLVARAVAGLECPLEIGVAPNIELEDFKSRWKALSPIPAVFTVGKTADVLLRARAAIVCSGTATLEAALCHCPMTVIYELPRIMRLEATLRRLKRPQFIALPNIMLDRLAVPEIVDMNISSDLVHEKTRTLLAGGPDRQLQLDAFSELETLLGPSDAINRTAELAACMLAEL